MLPLGIARPAHNTDHPLCYSLQLPLCTLSLRPTRRLARPRRRRLRYYCISLSTHSPSASQHTPISKALTHYQRIHLSAGRHRKRQLVAHLLGFPSSHPQRPPLELPLPLSPPLYPLLTPHRIITTHTATAATQDTHRHNTTPIPTRHDLSVQFGAVWLVAAQQASKRDGHKTGIGPLGQ